MPHRQGASEIVLFMAGQARERCREWEHPVTAEEGDIQSLIFDNLFNDGDRTELALLYVALHDQRINDSREYRDNRAEFDRRWTASFSATKDRFDSQRTKNSNN